MLNPLYYAVAWVIVQIHKGMAVLFGANSGASWALAIVLLTVAMRLVLFPLFVKQIKTQRAMQVLQPKIKELQAKYKGDRERLNTELMALYREHGANPLSGCLPILVQIPIFIALFHVLNEIKPDKAGQYHAIQGMTRDLVQSAAQAKIFGVPIAAAFNSNPHTLQLLNASATSVKVLATVLVVLMGVSTFITQKQLMAKTAPAEGAMATQQKVLLYVLPFTFFIFGFRFPIGVLLYWLTTNVWSMGQQYTVIHRMGPGPGAPPAKQPARRPPAPAPASPPAEDGEARQPAAPARKGGGPATPGSARRPAQPRKRSRSRRGRRR